MQKKMIKISVLVLSSFFVVLLTAGVTTAVGGISDMFGLQDAGKYAEVDSNTLSLSSEKPIDVIANIIQTGLSLLSIVFFIIVMYAGFKWMIAFGNTEGAEKAKSTLETALIGLAIILASYAITRFIFIGLKLGA